MKRKFIIFSLTILIVQCFSLTANASITPIIISYNSSVIITSNHTVRLKLYIVDNNPDTYEIFENGQILQPNKTIFSDIILYDFSNIFGNYNLTLFIFDYSNYTSSTNTFIVIEPNQSGNYAGPEYFGTEASSTGLTLAIL